MLQVLSRSTVYQMQILLLDITITHGTGSLMAYCVAKVNINVRHHNTTWYWFPYSLLCIKGKY